MSDQEARHSRRIPQNTRKVIASIVMVLCIAAMFVLPFEVLRVGERLLLLVGVFSYCAYTLHRRWWVPVFAFVVAMFISVYAVGGDLFTHEMISETPLQPLPTLDVSVIPGGESLSWSIAVGEGPRTVFKNAAATVCFYIPDDGLCVVAAHSCGLKTGEALIITPNTEDLVPGIPRSADVLVDSQYGVVLERITCPDPGREQLPLANEEDISVGEEAIIRTLGNGDIRVKVIGFAIVSEGHLLVLELLDDVEVGPGMSGSPIIQSGKVIGFFIGTTLSFIGPDFVLARPAVEVYAELQEYLES
jgi:hypothetical protein